MTIAFPAAPLLTVILALVGKLTHKSISWSQILSVPSPEAAAALSSLLELRALLLMSPLVYQAWKLSCQSFSMIQRLPSTSSSSCGWLISMMPSAATPIPANVTG